MSRRTRNITQDELKALLNYDSETGVFTWKIRLSYNVPAGAEAGCIEKTYGYHLIGIGKASYRAHRLAWLYMTGEMPSVHIDHINGNKADNRFANLRKASYAENGRNAKLSITNKSGVKGVSWHKSNQLWVANLRVNKKHKYIGGFKTIEEAANAIKQAREELHGQYANHG